MGQDGELKCEDNELQKDVPEMEEKKSVATEGRTRRIQRKKTAAGMGACRNEQRAVLAWGYTEQGGKVGSMGMNKRKRVKEFTGAEL